MAARSALHTAGAVTDAPDARLAQAANWAKNGLTPRTGVVYAGNQNLLTATASTAPMQVKVSALHFVGSKADAQGVYQGANDGDYLLTIAAAPGSGSRTDVVYIMQQDSNAGTTSPDASTAPLIAATSGALPAGAARVGSVVVPAGVTKLTDSGVVVATDCQWTATAGAPIPVRNSTERDALTTYLGLQCLRLDMGGAVQTYTGSGWMTSSTNKQSGTADLAGDATNQRFVDITFPVPYVAAPNVWLQALTGMSTSGTTQNLWPSAITTTGFRLNGVRNNTTTITVRWFAETAA